MSNFDLGDKCKIRKYKGLENFHQCFLGVYRKIQKLKIFQKFSAPTKLQTGRASK